MYLKSSLNLPKFYRASSDSWRAPTGKWQWLTDQSERAIYFCNVINTDIQQVKHCFILWFQVKVSFIILSTVRFRLASKC